MPVEHSAYNKPYTESTIRYVGVGRQAALIAVCLQERLSSICRIFCLLVSVLKTDAEDNNMHCLCIGRTPFLVHDSCTIDWLQ